MRNSTYKIKLSAPCRLLVSRLMPTYRREHPEQPATVLPLICIINALWPNVKYHKKRARPVGVCPLALPTYGREHQRNPQRSYRSYVNWHNGTGMSRARSRGLQAGLCPLRPHSGGDLRLWRGRIDCKIKLRRKP